MKQLFATTARGFEETLKSRTDRAWNQITDYAVKFAIDNTVENLMKADGFVFQYSFSGEDEEKEYKKSWLKRE